MKPLIKVVPFITSKEESAHRKKKSYPSAHRAGLKAEKKIEGKTLFDKINRKIQQLPDNHWAATHTSVRGNVHISQEFLDMFPPEERPRVKKGLITHEITEHKKQHPKVRNYK